MNVAMLSYWHVHAKDYERQYLSHDDCKIVAVWDEIESRGKEAAERLGCDFFPDADEIFSNPDIDGVIIDSPTNMHGELIRKAAAAGKHIFTEKVMTITGAEARELSELIREKGICFTISFPHKTRRALRKLKEMADDGVFGKLTYARLRNVHSGSIKNWLPAHFYDGEACGGGAMIDLGAHPMYVLAWFLGKPKAVSSIFTNVTDRAVEDNAVSLLQYENGAIGVSETGFVSSTDPYIFELSGTKGYATSNGTIVTYRTEDMSEFKTIAEFEADDIMPLSYWISCVKNKNTPSKYTLEEAVVLSEIMDAAYRSHRNGSVEIV